MVDYSKWDNLELSDDSDIEVHPNVDKKSFIRWKQRDIHEKRAQRKQDIENLKLSNQVNATLQTQIDEIITRLKMGGMSLDERNIAAAFKVDESKIGNAPTGPNGPSYTQMLSSLFDEIRKSVAADDDKKEAYIKQLEIHRNKIGYEIAKNAAELAKLEKEEKTKITSEGLHEGFNSSFVAKPNTKPPVISTKDHKPKQKVQAVEVLNPQQSGLGDQFKPASSGAEADSEESDDMPNEDDIVPTDLGKKFGEMKVTDLKKSMTFIEDHPEVVSERNQDGLMVNAFNAQMEGKESLAKQYVHQALLLQYVKQVGRNGIKTFFTGIADRNHKAHAVFNDDVNTTATRIRSRTKEILSERGIGDSPGGVEQIQLQAVDPNTAIHINVPPPNSDDPEVKEARKIFDAFPPGLQRALERGALEDINVVLGKMAVDEAEEIVELLGQGGMLSIEPKIIDTTKGETVPERLTHPEPPNLPEVAEEELD